MKFLKRAKMMLAAIMGAGLIVSASTAMATPISGGINFVGTANFFSDLGPVHTFTTDYSATSATATGIDFVSGMTLGGHTGAYASIPNFTVVTHQDFYFLSTLDPSPVVPLWTLTSGGVTYDFDMTSVSSSVGPNSLTLNGTGILGISAGGYDDTEGHWTMTIQDGVADLTFSAASVPEPATLILLGTGLVGIGFFGRRKNGSV